MISDRLHVEPLEDRLAPAAAGSLVPTFGTDGIERFTTGTVGRVAVVPDGHILAVVGSGTVSVERLGPDGMPDPTFGTGGAVPVAGSIFSPTLTPLSDGGVLVGWLTSVGGTYSFSLTRITAAGVVDTTFGTGGTAVVSLPANTQDAHLADVVVQPDGRIVVAGDQTTDPLILGQPPRYYHLVVTRLTAAGQPDATFGTGGTAVVTDPTGSVTSASAGSLAIQPDGRILVSAAASTTPVGVRNRQFVPAAVRLTADGQLDPSFGTAGLAEVGFPQEGTYGAFQAVSVLADGRVVLAGEVMQTSGAFVGVAARLSAAGQLDPTYGTGGLAVTAPFVTGSGGVASGQPNLNTAIDRSGRVVFDSVSSAGNIQAGYSGNTVTRLTAGGALDTGFGTNGQVSVSGLPGLGGQNASGLTLEPGLAVLPDGDILLGGTDQATQANNASGLIAQLLGSTPPAGFVPSAPGTVVVGGPSDGTFQVLNPSGGVYTPVGTVTAFPDVAGEVRVATGDVNGDGTPDYVVGAGPGGPPEVKVFDGKTGAVLADFLAFEPSFTGGVFVAAADLNANGSLNNDVIVTPDQGGGPRVVVFAVAGGTVTPQASFFGIDDPNFRGGARVAAGDVNQDGHPDLVVAAGFGGGPRVAIFEGLSILLGGGNPVRLIGDFFAFPGADAVNLRNGTYAAVGDVDGDGFADLIFGGGPGGAPRVFILSGAVVSAGTANGGQISGAASAANVAAAQANPLANFFVAGNTTDRGGVRVATTDADRDGRADVAVGSGAGSAARVRVYLGKNVTSAAEPGAFQDVSVFGGAVLSDGVFVG